MASSRVSTQLAARLTSASGAVRRSQRAAVTAATMILKDAVLHEAAGAVGPDLQLSHLGRKGGPRKKLGATFDIKGTDNPTALLRAVGPWGIPEGGAKPHEETARLGKITGRGAARARRQRDLNVTFRARGAFAGTRPMKMPDGRYRYRVQHPGAKGKHPFRRGIDRATPRAVQELRTVVTRTVVDVITVGRQTFTYDRGGSR